MADYVLSIKVDGVETAVSSIGELEGALKGTNGQLSNITVQGGGADKAFKTLATDADAVTKSINGINTSAKTLGQTVTTGAQVSSALKDSGKSAENLGKSVEGAATKSTSLRTELRQVTLELQNLQPGSARFQELAVRAGELREQIGDTQAVISSLAGSSLERLGKALGSTINIGIAGFQAIQGAQALFGSENEELQKTLVKLSALLNLSQAFETFGQLGDKITEIKAGFSSLFPAVASTVTATSAEAAASGAAATALGAQTVATEGATVATTGLGLAMKALPIVAIIGAIVALGSALYSYVSSNEEAEKAEKERLKRQKELKEAEEERKTTIANESGEYVLLLTQLKQTNSGSKERKQLIDQINSTYGTTLKNLSDEKAFQDQVNGSVEDYIRFQTNRYTIQKNQDKFNAALKRQDEIQSNIAANENKLKDFYKTLNEVGDNNGYLGTQISKTNKTLQEQRGELTKTQKEIYDLGAANNDLTKSQNTLTNGGKQFVQQTASNTTAIDAQKKATDELNKSNDALADSQKKLQEQNDKFRTEQARLTKTAIDDLELEKEIAIRNANDEQANKLKSLEKEITNKDLFDKTKRQLDIDYDLFRRKLEDDFNAKIKDAGEKELKDQQEKLNQLILQRQILNEEITVGDQNTTDTIKRQAIERSKIQKEVLDQQIKDQEATLGTILGLVNGQSKSYVDLVKERSKLELEILTQTNQEDLKLTAAQTLQKLLNQKAYYEQTYGLALKYNKDTNEFILDEDSKLNKRQEGETEQSFENRKKIQNQALQNINKEAENLENDKNSKIANINDKFRLAQAQLDKQTAADVTEAKIEEIQRYADKVFAILNTLSGFASQLLEIEKVNNENALNDLRDKQVQQTNVITEQYNAQITALDEQLSKGLISRQDYEQKVKSLEEGRKESSKAIEKSIADEQKKIRKDAFEKEKNFKIAQAVISGAQGALNAFLGPFSNPVLVASGAAPIIGAAQAALVGVTTALQIAAIKKTKFDEGAPEAVEVKSAGSSGGSVAGSPVQQASSGGFTGFSPQVTGAQFGTPVIPGQPPKQGPLRVYVVESDITQSQERVRTLESNASFG